MLRSPLPARISKFESYKSKLCLLFHNMVDEFVVGECYGISTVFRTFLSKEKKFCIIQEDDDPTYHLEKA